METSPRNEPIDYNKVRELIGTGEAPEEAEEPSREPASASESTDEPEKAPESGAESDPTDDTTEDENAPESASQEVELDDEPVNLREIAEKLEIDPKYLYEMEIPMPNGREPITLGEFKDRADQLMKLDEERATYETERSDYERRAMVERKELQDLLAVIPPEAFTPQAIQAAQNAARDTAAREREALEATRPELRDPIKYGEFRASLASGLAEYGFRPAEIDQVVDHRTLRLAADFLELKRKVSEAETTTEAVQKTKPAKKPGRKGKTLRSELLKKAAAPDATEGTKLAAVKELMKG